MEQRGWVVLVEEGFWERGTGEGGNGVIGREGDTGPVGDWLIWLWGGSPLHAGPSELHADHSFTMVERALDLESQCLSTGLSPHLLNLRYELFL